MGILRVPTRRQRVYGRDAGFEAAIAMLTDELNVLVVGAKGMGKSLFLTELLARPWAEERVVIRIHGSRMMSQERYGALYGGVVVGRPTAASRARIDEVIANPRLLARKTEGASPVVIAVDDAHLLDVFSLDWLARVSAAELATLVLSSQPVSAATVPDAATRQLLTDLWSAWGGERIDLGPIGRAAGEQLVAELIGPEAMESGWGPHLYWRSGGSPQLLRELAAQGVRTGEFCTPPPIQPPPLAPISGGRIGELMRPRLEQLDGRRLSELVALGSLGPTDPADARELLSWEGVTELLDQGLVIVDPLTGRLVANEVAASCAMGLAERDDLARTAATAAERLVRGLSGRLDELSFVELRFVAQSWLRPPRDYEPRNVFGAQTVRRLLLRAARASTRAGQPELGVECALHLLNDCAEDFSASIELANAHLARHEHDEAERVLTALEPPTSLSRGRVLLRLHHNLLTWHRCNPELTETFLAGAARWFDVPAWRAEVAPVALLVALLQLDREAALRLHAEIMSNPGASRGRRMAATALAAATVATCGDVELAERMLAGQGHPARYRGGVGFIALCCRVMISMFTGTPPPHVGDELFAMGQDALRRHDLEQLVAISWLSGIVVLRWGEDAEAAAATAVNRYATQATAEGMRAFLGAEHARALARHGELERAEAELEQVEAIWVNPRCTLFGYLRDRARVEVLRARGERERSRALALEAAERLRPASPLLTSMLLYSAFRDGEPPVRLSAQLDAIADGCPAPASRIIARHVRAALNHDAAALHAVSHELRALVGRSYAAEEASAQARAAEDELPPNTVRLDPYRTQAALSLLSEREREIVVLAAQGVSNTGIAERLYLSVRTVESHLYHARVKLGVTGRESLSRLA